ncbi:Synaptogenesis protein, partial [Schistosoma japonicum]
RNTATENEWIDSEAIILNVLFPPQRVSLNFGDKSVVQSGEQLVINCQADSSNPVAVITWRHYQCGPAHAFYRRHLLQQQQKLPKTSSSTNEGEKCKLLELKGSDEEPVPGASGGLLARSHLWLRPTWRYHLDFIECQAENPVYGPPIWHDRLQLNITFAPQFYGLQVGDQRVIREGESTHLDFGLYANPPVTSISWFYNDQLIPFEPKETDSWQGVFAAGSIGELLSLHKITRENMGNYTVIVSNSQHESRNSFFLNVTYPASIIGKLEENITQMNKEYAALDCKVNANPAISSKTFTWYRYSPPKSWMEEIDEGALQLSEPIYCNQSYVERPKMFAHCFQQDIFHISSTFYIYQITEEDVGKYVCEVNNGIGEPMKKTFNLLYHFAPKIIQLPRYTKAAGEQGSKVWLTCFIRTEPTPQIAWLKDNKLISLDALIQSKHPDTTNSIKKYESILTHIRPGLYKAQLAVNDIRKYDFGSYSCQAVNLKGEAQLGIHLSGTSTPEVPINFRLLNATQTTLHVAWTQGFDGGSAQTFQVRWREVGSVSLYKYADVASNDNRNGVEYLITGLKPGSEYIVSVNSMNTKHGASGYTEPIHLRTLSSDSYGGRVPMPPLSAVAYSDDNALLIIVSACVFGFVILLVNAVVIGFLIKRRRHRNMLRRRQHKPDQGVTMANGVALTNHDPSSNDTMKAHLQPSFVDHNDNFIDTDNSTTCICCPPKKQKLISSDMDQRGNLGSHTNANSIPDFTHLTSNQMTSGYPVRHLTSPTPYFNNTLHCPATRHGSTDLGIDYSSTNPVNLIRREHGSIKHSTRHGQHTPRQANQSRYYGTLQNPSSYRKLTNDQFVIDNKINECTQLQSIISSTASFVNGSMSIDNNGLGLTIVNDSFHMTSCQTSPQNIVTNQAKNSSTEILSTGLAAFTHIKRKSEYNDTNEGNNLTSELCNTNNLPNESSPIVSIKVTSFADPFNPHSMELGSDLATFSYSAPFDYNISPSCTPIFLSVDPSESNSLLMSNSVMNYPPHSNRLYEMNGKMSVTPLMIHSPTPVQTDQLLTKPNLGGTRYFCSSREVIQSNTSRQNIPHFENRQSVNNLSHAISSELITQQNQCTCGQQCCVQKQHHIHCHKRLPYSCPTCLKSSLHNSKQSFNTLNTQNTHTDNFSEEDKDSDRSRYVDQLRRIQYSGGPTAQLLLGNINIQNDHSSPDSNLSPNQELHNSNEFNSCLTKSKLNMHKIDLLNTTENNNSIMSKSNQFNQQTDNLINNEKLEKSQLLYSDEYNCEQQNQYIINSLSNVDNNIIKSTHLSDCFV